MAELGEIIDTNLNDGQDAVNNVVPEVQLHANIEPQPPLGVLANDPIAEMSDMDAKAIANFIRNELIVPLRLSLLIMAVFWSMLLHGSPYVFPVGAVFIFIASITCAKDIAGPLPPSVRRSDLQLLEMRLIQLFVMYCQLLCIHLLSWLTLPFIYFQNVGKLGEEIVQFFSVTEPHANIHWTAYIRISNQIFWLSFTWMVAARIVSNLFLMSRTPSFRSLLRYEVEAVATSTISILIGVVAFNNAAKKTMGKYPIVATALLLTLIVWVVLCHLRSTFYKKELGIPRRNDFSGLLRVMTIIMSQLLVGALLYSLLSLITSVTIESLAIPTSTSIPEVDILNYWHAVQTGKFKSGPERNVIELNKNLLLAIISNVLMTRFLKHRYDMNKLDSILDPIRP